jgi:hypothetical protein
MAEPRCIGFDAAHVLLGELVDAVQMDVVDLRVDFRETGRDALFLRPITSAWLPSG